MHRKLQQERRSWSLAIFRTWRLLKNVLFRLCPLAVLGALSPTPHTTHQESDGRSYSVSLRVPSTPYIDINRFIRMDRNQRLVSVTGPFPGSMNDMDNLERTMVSLGKKQQERDGEVWLIGDSAYVSRDVERAENGRPSSSQCR